MKYQDPKTEEITQSETKLESQYEEKSQSEFETESKY